MICARIYEFSFLRKEYLTICIRPAVAMPVEESYNPHMAAAITSAFAGVTSGDGGPFGCCIIKDDQVVAVAHNTVLRTKDPTAHAEMNCIRTACRTLSCHDLSDCVLFTSAEPCPMCWSACFWARIPVVHIGVSCVTTAEFGFDDEIFYEELEKPCQERMIQCTRGAMRGEIEQFFEDSPSHKRKFAGGDILKKVYKEIFAESESTEMKKRNSSPLESLDYQVANVFMKAAVDAAAEGIRKGENKEREPFGCAIVQNGTVIATAHNTVIRDRDPTATAEVNAIRAACARVGSLYLEDCELYSTSEPDLMSLGAIYWSRIKNITIGVSSHVAAQLGFEDGLLQYRELRRGNKGSRAMTVIENCMEPQCREVFLMWMRLDGKLY